MLHRWKRLIAVLLLALVAFGASAATCATLCAGDHGTAMSSAAADEGASGFMPASASVVPDDCPLTTLCSLAASPVILTASADHDVAASAYVTPLARDRSYERDADPPQKPPAI